MQKKLADNNFTIKDGTIKDKNIWKYLDKEKQTANFALQKI